MLIRAITQPVKTSQPHISNLFFNELAGKSLQNYAFPGEFDNMLANIVLIIVFCLFDI